MRVGQNPAKIGIKAPQRKRLGIGIICYIPNQSGYFEESLRILKIEIASLRTHTSEPFDLYLFDNGSCTEVVDVLKQYAQSGVINFLTLSHENIGKFGAMNFLMASMSNEWVGYTDADFYYRTGWLEESLRIADAFPETAMITAQPNFFDQLEGKPSQALSRLKPGRYQQIQDRLETAVIEDYCKGIGATDEIRQKYLNLDSTILENHKSGTRAVFGATTAQFIGQRERFVQVFPLPHDYLIAREEDNELCRKVDSLGWLELSTLRPYVIHMGNHLDEEILQEAEKDGMLSEKITVKAPIAHHKNNLAWKFLTRANSIGWMRKLLKRVYVNLFELYSVDKK